MTIQNLIKSEVFLKNQSDYDILSFLVQVSDASLAQMPEFRQRVDVLRRMQYLAEDDTVQMKVKNERGGNHLMLRSPKAPA